MTVCLISSCFTKSIERGKLTRRLSIRQLVIRIQLEKKKKFPKNARPLTLKNSQRLAAQPVHPRTPLAWMFAPDAIRSAPCPVMTVCFISSCFNKSIERGKRTRRLSNRQLVIRIQPNPIRPTQRRPTTSRRPCSHPLRQGPCSATPRSLLGGPATSGRVVHLGPALGDGTEILPMSRELQSVLARVPVLVVKARDNPDVVGTRTLRMSVNPEFRRGMLVAENVTGLARDGIAHAGDAEGENGLIRQEGSSMLVADPRGTESVQLRSGRKIIADFAKLPRSQDSNGAAERVAGDDEPVVGVGFDNLQNPGLGSLPDFGPGVPEAGVNMALCAQVRVSSKDVEIRFPVRQRLGTSKCEHNEPVGVVHGEKPCVVGPEGVLELKGSVRLCSFHQGAISTWTSD